MPDGTPSIPRTPQRGGRGRRNDVFAPKGRTADPEALAEVRDLLEERPRRADLLIEHLHLLQDTFGHLLARHLVALSEEMHLPLAAVYETASFYAHFDLVMDGETAPPPLTIRVCDSLTCEMMGAQQLLTALEDRMGPEVRVVRAPCMGRCEVAPVVEVGHRHAGQATVETVAALAEAREIHPQIPAYRDLASYRAEGGYRLLTQLLDGTRTAESIVEELEASGLRGLGGAGFRTGLKWNLVRRTPAPRLMAVNADEGEPGTFKDRWYLERDPHRFLEGTLIAAAAAECETCWIYLRDEYPQLREVLLREIAALEAAGLTKHCRLELRRGAGAYICGEESAMLESIEGRRGYPRHKPPYPTDKGLWGRPTLIHNVETLYWVRDIVEKGAQWFASEGRNGRKGLRSFSVSGRVKEPGVKLAPAGITIRELIEEYCGGMADGHELKAYLPGGASGGILPASLDNVPLDFDTLQEHGCFIGSAAVMILSDKDDIRAAVQNLMRFFEDESCGQCTPCRVGTEKAVKLLEAERWDVPLLQELSKVMMGASICGLGQAAPNPVLSALKYFPEEVLP